MPIVKSKYRGSVAYHLVFARLVEAAQCRGAVLYEDVAALMGIFKAGAFMGSATGHLLGEISEDEVDVNRPMLSAVAVSGRSLKPSDGFFSLALTLGLLKDDSTAGRQQFWDEQREAAYRTWRKPSQLSQQSKAAKASA